MAFWPNLAGFLAEKTGKCLLNGWPGVLGHVIVELMAVDGLMEHFDAAKARRIAG